MWIPQTVIDDVDNLASVYYVNFAYSQKWNQYRKSNELRMMSGWAWVAKHNQQYRYGFKSKTVAYRDAWYTLVKKSRSPLLTIGDNRK